jgi:hypothetical protein
MKRASLLTSGLLAAICLAAAACSEPASTGAPSTAETPPDPAAAAQVGPAQTLPRSLPAPSPEHPRFVGLWAASADGCSDPAWRFEASRVSTRGEVSCDFARVSAMRSGYGIAARCTAEAPPQNYHIEISFAESARAMMISGGPWTVTSLVYCAPLSNP